MKFLLGLAVGFAAALLFAPARGEDTREKILRSVEDLASEGRDRVYETTQRVSNASQDKLHEAAEKLSSAAKDKAGQYGGQKGRDVAEKVTGAVTSKLERPA